MPRERPWTSGAGVPSSCARKYVRACTGSDVKPGSVCGMNILGWTARVLRVAVDSWGAQGTGHARGYAKKPVVKGKGRSVAKEDVKGPEVCKDPALLTTHAMGVNIYKQGPEVVLKKDSEYPDWLFQVHLGPPKTLQELDPETPQYWRLLRKHNIWRHNKLSKNKKF